MLTNEFKEGRPKSVVVPQNIKQYFVVQQPRDAVRRLIKHDRHVTYREINASLGIRHWMYSIDRESVTSQVYDGCGHGQRAHNGASALVYALLVSAVSVGSGRSDPDTGVALDFDSAVILGSDFGRTFGSDSALAYVYIPAPRL
ncbi:hypothetical protein EVAR_60398_1 [Eumeta japonica]|uniref:Uncharacterized protein n=1 Tax=Eumeta variegata TaxID=151549 RepID=A0A4C1YN63_EUMVA|nr:hypothetical protein EVAR_60398_1 [Eumeta japonica]